MNTILSLLDASEVTTQSNEFAALKFVEDVDYEFVGGGSATNGY